MVEREPGRGALHSVTNNTFTIDRDLLGYQRILGRDFVVFLGELRADDHWIDAGAGQARAVGHYLRHEGFPTKARVTAVGIQKPAGAELEALEGSVPRPGFRYLSGRPIEQIPVDELRTARLISDVYGPLQYCRQIDELIGHYAALLQPSGRLWTVLPATTFIGTAAGTSKLPRSRR